MPYLASLGCPAAVHRPSSTICCTTMLTCKTRSISMQPIRHVFFVEHYMLGAPPALWGRLDICMHQEAPLGCHT